MLVGVIADDLSGASGVAGDFARFGLTASVMGIEDDRCATERLETTDVLVIHTGSRALEAAASAAVNDRAARALAGHRPYIVIHKIDSLLRGPMGSDLAAVMAVLQQRRAVVVAAVPGQGRKTVNGVQWSGEAPLSIRGADGQDRPLRLAERFAGAGHAVHPISLTIVDKGLAAIEQAMREAGEGLFTCDAVTEAHVGDALHAALTAGIRLVVSSYGVAHSLLSACARDLAGPVLAVAGSVSDMGRRQLAHVLASGSVAPVRWDAAWPRDSNAGIQCKARVCSLLEAGRDVLVHSVDPNGWASSAPDESVGARMGHFLRALVPALPRKISGFVATGGETAELLCSALDASRLTMLGAEALPCAPFAVIEGGAFSGATFITKPGAFGDTASLAAMIALARIAGLSGRQRTLCHTRPPSTRMHEPE